MANVNLDLKASDNASRAMQMVSERLVQLRTEIDALRAKGTINLTVADAGNLNRLTAEATRLERALHTTGATGTAVAGQMSGAFRGLDGVLSNLGLGGLGMIGSAAGLGAVAIGVGKLTLDLTKLGEESAQLEARFNAFAGGAAQGAANLQLMSTAVAGVITRDDQMIALNKLMASGLTDTAQEAAKVAEAAVWLGSATAQPLDRIEALTNALLSGRTKGLVPYGIDMDKLKGRMAELQAANGSLTASQATLNAFMEQAGPLMRKVQDEGGLAATSTQKLAVAWGDLKDQMGSVIAPRITPIIEGTAQTIASIGNVGPYLEKQRATAAATAALNDYKLAVQNTAMAEQLLAEAQRTGFGTGAEQQALDIARANEEAAARSVRAWEAVGKAGLGEINVGMTDEGRKAVATWGKAGADAASGFANAFNLGLGGLPGSMDIVAQSAAARMGAAFKGFDFTKFVDFQKAQAGFNLSPIGSAPQFDLQRAAPAEGLAYLQNYNKIAESAIQNLTGFREDATSADLDTQSRMAKEASAAWREAAASTERRWTAAANVLMSITGVPGGAPSAVTQTDVDLSKAGLYQNKPDEYLRRLRDEVAQGKDIYPQVSVEDAAARMGISGGVDPKAILALFEKQWASGELFANKGNLDLIDKDAVARELASKQAAAQGIANVQGAFGVPLEGMKGQTDLINAIQGLINRLPAVIPGANALPGAAVPPAGGDLAKPGAGAIAAMALNAQIINISAATASITAGTLAAPAGPSATAQAVNITIAAGGVLIGGDTSTGAETRLRDWLIEAFRGFAQSEQRRAPSAPAFMPGNP
jgi:hypothetical protein